METLIKVERRFFFRRYRAKPGYHWESRRVADFVKAHEFLDVKITLGTDRRGIPSQAYDALLEGRYREAQTIAMDAGTPLRLTITGTLGDVVKPADARREAFDRHVSLIEDSGFLLDEANAQWGTNFRSARSAARYILQTDGEYAGIDLVDEICERRGNRRFERVLVGHSFGCLHDDIRDRVPEFAGLIPWHRYGSGWVTAILPDDVLASVLALHHEDLNARASDTA